MSCMSVLSFSDHEKSQILLFSAQSGHIHYPSSSGDCTCLQTHGIKYIFLPGTHLLNDRIHTFLDKLSISEWGRAKCGGCIWPTGCSLVTTGLTSCLDPLQDSPVLWLAKRPGTMWKWEMGPTCSGGCIMLTVNQQSSRICPWLCGCR